MSVALKHNRSIKYIVDKVILAISKVYRARPSQEDKDLAFVVLKLGGPALLDIVKSKQTSKYFFGITHGSIFRSTT